MSDKLTNHHSQDVKFEPLEKVMPRGCHDLRLLASASGLAALLCACLPSLRSSFADAAYSDEPVQVPARDAALVVDAALAPHLLADYHHPRDVGRCFELAARAPSAVPSLWGYAECAAAVPARDDCARELSWVEARAEGDGAASPWRLSGCLAALRSGRDRLRALIALMDAAEAFRRQQLAASGASGLGAAPAAAESAALLGALEHAARVLEHDPAEHPEPLPVLALSGGAANGAFVAGYLYGLLWTREQARRYAGPAHAASIDRYRFRGMAGSSVGSLVGLALDLYFSAGVPDAVQERALDACIRRAGPPVSGDPARKMQDCALAKLRSDFVQNEWELLCARSGNVLELTTPDFSSMLEFEPLERDTLAPFFDAFAGPITANAFARTALVVDLEQNVLVGLDERACRMPGMDRKRCLSEAVLASIVEPVFVPARSRVFSGLNGARGEPGTWFDGSLRSLNPAFRAASFGLGKVLALNTSRAAGQPQPPPAGAVPILLATTDTLGAGQRSWELAYAESYQRQRASRACELGRKLAEPELCDVLGRSSAHDGLRSVWVPEDVAPAALFAKGYTFDPLVMRGLFLWGEKEFLRTRSTVVPWLGWCAIGALERPAPACPELPPSPAFSAALARELQAVEREIAGLGKYEDRKTWQSHQRERKRLVESKLETCRD